MADYDTLKQTAEAEWLTDGPNSGGCGGWLLVGEHMHEFSYEHGAPGPTMSAPIMVAEFRRRFESSRDPRVRIILDYLAKRGA